MTPKNYNIETGGDVEVQVLLQAMKEDPPPDARCRDKFLVQSVAVKSDLDVGNVSQIWSNIEQNAKSSIQEKKIRVSFLPADSGAQTNGVMASSTPQHDDEPPAYSSPSPNPVTPQRSTAEKDIKSEGESTANSTMIGSAAAAVSNAVPTSQEDLKAQLEEAKATITRLRAQAEEGLRQRKPQEAAQKAVDSVQQSMQNAPAPGGVPVQIVAGLCLLCFIIAWLFF